MSENVLIKELYKNKLVKDFCLDNCLSEKEILKNYAVLSQCKDISDICMSCKKKGSKKCLSLVDGMTCHLEINQNRIIQIIYDECQLVKMSNVGSLELIDFGEQNIDIIITPARTKLFSELNKFLDEYLQKGYSKGLYLYGKWGVGKSVILYNFAKTIVGKGAKVLFVYYPDFVRQIQTSFGTGNTESLVLKLKKADILMIDDIGREANTAYIRDEILGPILQYRCDNMLPLFMTSNRNFKELDDHLSETNNLIDKVKSGAIIERFKYLMMEYELNDCDFRNK